MKKIEKIFGFLCIRKLIVCSMFMFKFYARLNLGSSAYIVSYCAFYWYLYVLYLSSPIHLIATEHVLIFTLHDNVACVYVCVCVCESVLLGCFFFVNENRILFHMCAHLDLIDSSSFGYIGKIAFIRSQWKLSCLNLSIHSSHCHIMLSTLNDCVFHIILMWQRYFKWITANLFFFIILIRKC